jgi:hypothetical protein
MPLVTAQQFQSPSILQEVQQGIATRGEIQRQGMLSREEANRQRLSQLAEAQAAEQKGLLQKARGVEGIAPEEATQQEAVNLYYANNPAEGEKLFKRLGIETEEQKQDLAAFADTVLQAQNEEEVNFLIDERVRKVNARGGDPSETLLLKDLMKNDPEKLRPAMQGAKAAALTAFQREQIGMQKEGLEARKAGAGAPGQDPVQSSKILDDGTVQLVRKSGAVEVKSPEDTTKELVKQAQRFGAELQGLRSGERDAAKAAINQSVDAFKKLAPIKKNIKNLNEGIRLIDEGAESGIIAKHFPSMKAASINLDNLQGRLGLDIIADVTFGALSESELAFAKDTALPIGLEGEPLKKWLARKRDSQKILAETLEEAALFLGEPGNSVPDYIRMKRAQQPAQPTSQPAQPSAQGDLTPEEQAELAELKKRLGR